MARRGIAVVYCLPAAGAVVHWLVRHPSEHEAPAIAAVTFGGLAALALVLVVAVPLAVARGGEATRAARWRHVAIAALPYPVFLTFLWSLLFLPRLGAVGGAAVIAAGLALTALTAWWAGRDARVSTPAEPRSDERPRHG